MVNKVTERDFKGVFVLEWSSQGLAPGGWPIMAMIVGGEIWELFGNKLAAQQWEAILDQAFKLATTDFVLCLEN